LHNRYLFQLINSLIHVIIVTMQEPLLKHRKVLISKVAERLEQIIHEVAHENGWEVIQLAIQPDHVHLFICSNPYTLPTDIARLIKGRSSHVLREEFAHLKRMSSLWTRSTFYSTARNVSADIIQ